MTPTIAFRWWRPALAAAVLAFAACGGGGGGGDGGGATAPPPGAAPGPEVNGPPWLSFGHDAQHTAVAAIATQDLNRIAWSTPVDEVPQYQTNGSLLAHYGSPVISGRNTVVVPVKTGAAGGFRVEGRSGGTGALLWSLASDYVAPASQWFPSFNATITPAGRVVIPGAGGKVVVRESADDATSATQSLAFYGAQPDPALDGSVFIDTPVTSDAQGNLFFGFLVTGANAQGLVGGIARIDANGTGRWISAATAAADPAIVKAAMNSAPALSPDGSTLYVAVNAAAQAGVTQKGYLLALDSTTLAVKGRAALVDPATGLPARVSDTATSSPVVGPDGHVYFGVLESTFGQHNARGWLLHFDATLATQSVPGGFGWDVTPSLVPASMVPSYTGPSSYLLALKYNDYAGVGTGTGQNELAVIDPSATQIDPISGRTIMREVLKILSPTLAAGGPAGAREEWCINTMAVDPATRSILANNEDGILYRWNLATNTFSQQIQLNSGLGQAYTPTAVGADGAVYAVSNARLYAVVR
ncbi:hypothetical protein [Ramlibacter algicola]|uniref:Pyrrolo-quinoline quinone n=1 Tax=Ramlibacter algicola TaxID=2795217 RepID=A0A934Q040_9BURK|nr:hypothetical protein [Ramlibacter algicola]MBK0391842.1 hypothetical protein [Ramlibacter algicola]